MGTPVFGYLYFYVHVWRVRERVVHIIYLFCSVGKGDISMNHDMLSSIRCPIWHIHGCERMEKASSDMKIFFCKITLTESILPMYSTWPCCVTHFYIVICKWLSWMRYGSKGHFVSFHIFHSHVLMCTKYVTEITVTRDHSSYSRPQQLLVTTAVTGDGHFKHVIPAVGLSPCLHNKQSHLELCTLARYKPHLS